MLQKMIDLDKLEASCTRNSDLPPMFSAIKALELIAEVRKLKSALEMIAEETGTPYGRMASQALAQGEETK